MVKYATTKTRENDSLVFFETRFVLFSFCCILCSRMIVDIGKTSELGCNSIVTATSELACCNFILICNRPAATVSIPVTRVSDVMGGRLYLTLYGNRTLPIPHAVGKRRELPTHYKRGNPPSIWGRGEPSCAVARVRFPHSYRLTFSSLPPLL